MPQLKIDENIYNFNDGETILEIAERNNINIPALCRLKDTGRFTSCQVCIVKNVHTGRLIPSCSVNAHDGMIIDTRDNDVIKARRESIEMLLANHTGDCIAPCTRVCPLNINIPLMMKYIENNDIQSSYNLIIKEMPLPITLTNLCQGYCEKSCRRNLIDKSLKICSLKQNVLKIDKGIDIKKPSNGKKIAIIGTGLNGLSVGHFFMIEGFDCTFFDKHFTIGGSLLDIEKIDHKILNKELNAFRRSGCKFNFNMEAGKNLEIDKVNNDFDAVIISADIDYNKIIKNTFKVYYKNDNPILTVKHCKESVKKIMSILNGNNDQVENNFHSVIHIDKDHLKKLLIENISKANDDSTPDENELVNEARRCLHCECKKNNICKLREYASDYNAKQSRFKVDYKLQSLKTYLNNEIIYEQGKCIKCGICVRLSVKHKIKNGFTFFGKGFDLSVRLPFNNNYNENEILKIKDIIKQCPTGALDVKIETSR